MDVSVFGNTSYGSLSEAELISQARQDASSGAMLELLRRVSPFILSKSKQFSSTEQDRQDYYQEGVVGFLSAVYGYKPDCGATFKTYACTCSLNKMKDLLSHKNKEIALQLFDSVVSETEYVEDPEEALNAAVKAENIIKAISERLSAFEKKVLFLHLRGESYSSISKITGKSVKSVDNCLQRIRRKLRPEKDD